MELKERIEDGRIYDRNWNLKGRFNNDRIYDKNCNTKGHNGRVSGESQISLASFPQTREVSKSPLEERQGILFP